MQCEMKHGSVTSKQKTKVHVQMMAWRLANSTWKKKYTAVTSSRELHGYIRVAVMPTRITVSSNACLAKVTKLRARFQQFRTLGKWLKFCSNMIISFRTSVCEAQKLPRNWVGLCCHTQLYRHNLVSSDYHNFSKLKDSFRGTISEDDGSCEHVAGQFQCRLNNVRVYKHLFQVGERQLRVKNNSQRKSNKIQQCIKIYYSIFV